MAAHYCPHGAAMRHWRVAWIAVSAINRLQRMHKSPGSYLGLRQPWRSRFGCGTRGGRARTDHLVRTEWLPPPGALNRCRRKGGRLQAEVRELMGEAATLLLLIKQLEGSAGKVRDGSGEQQPVGCCRRPAAVAETW